MPNSDNSDAQAQKSTYLSEFLLSSSFITQVCRLQRPTQQMYQNSSCKFLKQYFTFGSRHKKEDITFSFNSNKTFKQKSPLFSFLYVLLTFLGQETLYFFWSFVLKNISFFPAFMSQSSFSYPRKESDSWTDLQLLYLVSLSRRAIWSSTFLSYPNMPK